MKLNFDFKMPSLDGSTEGNPKASTVLSQMLAAQNKGNSIKLYDWAIKVYNGKPLEIDQTDADVLYELINSTELLSVAAKVPLMNYIKSVKDKEKEKELKVTK